MSSRRRQEDDRRREAERDRDRRRDDTRHRATDIEPPRNRHDSRRADDVIMEDPRLRPEYSTQRMDARDSRAATRVDAMDMGEDYPPYGQRPARDPITSPSLVQPVYAERDDYSGRQQQFYEIQTPRNASYKEYFLPEDGINREVLQNEITAFLGGDATSRPYAMTDGRRGYLIKAYRALTTPMIASIKDASRNFEIPYETYAAEVDRQHPDRRGPGGYPAGMDIDEDYRSTGGPPGFAPPASVYPTTAGVYTMDRDRDVGRPTVQVDRHGQPISSSGYPQDPTYAVYSGQPPGVAQRAPGVYETPRTVNAGGRTPPQGAPPGYGVSGYREPLITQVSRAPVTSYDSRAPVQAAAYGYADRETRPSDRHRR